MCPQSKSFGTFFPSFPKFAILQNRVRGWTGGWMRSLTAWGMKPLIVWWYGSGCFCVFVQMSAKWTDFGLDCCCLFVSFGLCADISLCRCHWCSSRWVPIMFQVVLNTNSRVFLFWAMNEACQFVMFPCFLLFLDSTHFIPKRFNFGWIFPLIPCVCSISSRYYLSSMFWLLSDTFLESFIWT